MTIVSSKIFQETSVGVSSKFSNSIIDFIQQKYIEYKERYNRYNILLGSSQVGLVERIYMYSEMGCQMRETKRKASN